MPETDAQPPNDAASDGGVDDSTPAGAIIITVLLAGVILVFWFAMFALNLIRG